MASSIALQLAQLRAKGSNPLDSKALKIQHSESLIFDARVAATQDFDSLFLICHEAFHELCLLDSRFTGFASNIFSEQSKQQDRIQMTRVQTDKLNTLLDDFLGLVGGRLLLKPALKAVEWLVRRFRIQEYNTLRMILTFLPYHTTPIFSTLLSIMPRDLPPALRFLHPYIQSLANPPRHTIVYTATHNKSFFVGLNAHVLDVSRVGYHYPALFSFWAAIITEAVAAMLDQSRNGRREIQRQSQEDVVLHIMPTLNDGMCLEKVHDLQVGCYMIITVLATKSALRDEVLAALMDAVALGLSQTNHRGLICLAVLAQQKESAVLSKRVLKALLKIEKLDHALLMLKPQYNVENLALGAVLGIVEGFGNAQDTQRISLALSVIEADLMDESSMAIAITSIMSIMQTGNLEQRQQPGLQSSLIDLLQCLTKKENVRKFIEGTTGGPEKGIDLRVKEAMHRGKNLLEGHQESRLDNGHRPSLTESFEDAVTRIPTRTAHEISFLSHSDSCLFDSLASAFILASTQSSSSSSSTSSLKRFSDLPVLRKSLMMTEPLYLSFFVRVWCSPYQDFARAAAIDAVSECLRSSRLVEDVQFLLPYIIFGLADYSLIVRRASVNLLTALLPAYCKDETEKQRPNLAIFGREQIYGQRKQSSEVVWLSIEDAARFINQVLAPRIEEYVLDSNHISQHLSDILNGSKTSTGAQFIHKDLKTSLRQAFFAFLCSHVVNTPIFSMKFRLLKMLNQVEKVGVLSRSKALLPLLSESTSESNLQREEICNRYQISPEQFHEQLVGIVSPVDRDGTRVLQSIIETMNDSDLPLLLLAAYKRIRAIWSSLKPDLQLTLAKILLELAVGDTQRNEGETQRVESILTLQTISLSTVILQHFIENLSALPNNMPEKMSSKRRRTSHGHAAISSDDDSKRFGFVLKRFAFVLELVEAHNPREHPQLLKGLFQAMGELQQLKNLSGTDLGYLEVLTMENILSIIKRLERSPDLQLDQSAIKPNVLIDCLRTTASPQVRQRALLLMSSLASVTPELVLHSVMPIFTFMSATTLRQSDEYSAYVVAQTMELVIPQLVKSLHKRKEDLILGTSELLLSFVAAFEHIPSHRQLDLFKSLVNKLGPTDFLFALLILLLDKYPDDQVVIGFAANLAGSYDALTQLRTIEKYLAVNLDMLKPKPIISQHLVVVGGNRIAETVIAKMLPLLTVILRGERLINKTAKALVRNGENAVFIRALYAQILEQILLLSRRTRHDKNMESCCSKVLTSLLSLLSTSELVGALRSILESDENEVIRLQALNSFQQRLTHDLKDSQPAQKACLAFLPQLTSVLENSSSLPLKHAALACIDCISERFGKKDLDAVFIAARGAFSNRNRSPADRSFHIATLLCLGTMIEVLRDAFIPLIPAVLPQTFDHLCASIEEDLMEDGLHNAAYCLIDALLLHIPWIVTGTYLESLLRISYRSANTDVGEDWIKSRQQTLRLAARQIGPRESFAALCETWKNATTEGPNAVMEYLETFRVIIERQPKSMVLQQTEILTNILVNVFDLRRTQFSPRTEGSFEDNEVEDAETAIFESAITMIYKLNDATFRPIFLKIWEWTIDPISKKDRKANVYRRTTFYTFLIKFFDTLKSIVTSYADFIIEDAVAILRDVSLQDDDSKLLWRRVVTALQKAFEHDQDDFWQSLTHFSPMSECLLSQLSHGPRISMTSEVIPAITGLAVAADSANHHKGLNGAILQYTRSDNASVRLAAVQCEYSLTERLGEEWLALLPEMLPFISELQEDDDEAVEQETQRWIGKIEDILGESLNSMLQ